MNYKISIIIPVFNIENYIRHALESVIRQTIGFENLEVIMVNDCSTDRSGEIIDEYANKYTNFKAIHLAENSGNAGKPRNIGIENATSAYLMFLDPDDYYDDNICEILYNKIIEENIDIVFCNFNYIFDGISNKAGFPFGNVDEINLKTIHDNPKLFVIPPSLWTKIYNTDFIRRNNIKFKEDILAEDRVFVLKTFLEADGIIYLQNYFGTNYRRRNSTEKKSLSNANSKKNLMERTKGYTETYNILRNYKKEEYFPLVFSNIREFWTDGFITSNASSSEKKELLENITFLFEEFDKYNVCFRKDKRYLILLSNCIIKKRYDDAILLTEVLNDFIIKQKKLEKEKNNFQKQLNLLNKEMSEYLTTHGYLKYKSKNIAFRIKNKLTIL